MNKKWLLAVFCGLHIAAAQAQEKYTDLIAWLPEKAGVVCYSLAQSPSITLEGTAFVVSTKETSVAYEQGTVEYLTLGDGELAAAGIAERPREQSVKWQSDALRFKGCKAGDVVSVYDGGGRLLSQHQIDSAGNLSLSFGEGKRGVFVVKMNRWAMKIIRK